MTFFKKLPCVLKIMVFMCFTPLVTGIVFGGEFKIPSRMLYNGIYWEDDILDQNSYGLCASFATVDCLRYVHGNCDISPFFLHKSAHHWLGTTTKETGCAYRACDDYKTGHSLRNLMRFCDYVGVATIPEDHVVKPDSGVPFPTGTKRRAFRHLYDVFSYERGNSKVDKIKNALRKYKIPIAIGVISSINNRSILRLNSSDVPAHLSVNFFLPEDADLQPTKGYHALIAYGYSDSKGGILIKNSWGTEFFTHGKALIKYDYLEEYSSGDAYIGWSWKDYSGGYSESFGSGDFHDYPDIFSLAPPIAQ